VQGNADFLSFLESGGRDAILYAFSGDEEKTQIYIDEMLSAGYSSSFGDIIPPGLFVGSYGGLPSTPVLNNPQTPLDQIPVTINTENLITLPEGTQVADTPDLRMALDYYGVHMQEIGETFEDWYMEQIGYGRQPWRDVVSVLPDLAPVSMAQTIQSGNQVVIDTTPYETVEYTRPSAETPLDAPDPVSQFIFNVASGTLVDLVTGKGNPATSPFLNSLEELGVITEAEKQETSRKIDDVALIVGTAGLGTAVAGALRGSLSTTTTTQSGKTYTTTSQGAYMAGQLANQFVRAVVFRFIGASGNQINAYYSKTKTGRSPKTWMNSKKTVEYSNVPAEGFAKSKYPDKYGNTVYWRKMA